jgi:hypothetical protein
MTGRPKALGKYTQEEVRQKVLELGAINKAAKFYGVSDRTVSIKIGNFNHRGVKPEHIKEIRAMAKSHTKKNVAQLLGYTWRQIDWAARQNGIKFSNSRKPRWNSELTYYEMHNMDLIVKQYPSIEKCAEEHGVCTRTIDKHIKLSREARNCESHHNN